MKREKYIDYIKVLGIILVILLHVTSEGWYGNENVSEWSGYIVCLELGSLGVPLFFMATGMVMLNRDRQVQWKRIIQHNLPRFGIALFLYSLIYEMIDFAVHRKSGNFISVFFKDFLTVNVDSRLWFMYAIICVYLMIPVLKVFTDNASKQEKQYFLVMWFMCSVLEFLGNTKPFTFVVAYTNHLEYINIFIHYVGYLVLGNYIQENMVSRKNAMVKVLVSFMAFAFVVFFVYFQFCRGDIQYLSYTAMDYCSPFNIIICMTLAICIKQATKQEDANCISKIGGWTLGIYLVHVGLIRINAYYPVLTFENNYMVHIFAYTMILLLVSIGITGILRKIPCVGGYLG